MVICNIYLCLGKESSTCQILMYLSSLVETMYFFLLASSSVCRDQTSTPPFPKDCQATDDAVVCSKEKVGRVQNGGLQDYKASGKFTVGRNWHIYILTEIQILNGYSYKNTIYKTPAL